MSLLVLALGLASGVQALASPAQGTQSSVIYVDVDAASADDGTSWADAYADLQDALSIAGSGDEIWVAEGTYKPGTNWTDSFSMKNGVGIYGGFHGTEVSREERDWANHVTILSGDIGTEGDASDNSYHVLYTATGTELDTTAILDGFTISGGTADGPGHHCHGGGMWNSSSSPTVTNCTFSGNSAAYGGGMYNEYNSSPAVSNCTFSDNSASTFGGGMSNYDHSSPTVTNCTFSGNSAAYGGGMYNEYNSSPMVSNCTFFGNSVRYGGGMYNEYNSSPMVSNCTFSSNSALFGGGGMRNYYHSSPMVSDCTFSNNSGGEGGGGMRNYYHSSPTVTNCTFSFNSSRRGGGMSNDYSSSPTVSDCTFSNNSGGEGGGGMRNYYHSSPAVTNCTFSINSADEGGGLYNVKSSPKVTNCIFWGDSPGEIYADKGSPVVTHSDIRGGYTGAGNIDADPLFVDAASEDFHLGAGSPCIDAGDNGAPGLPPYDFEGDDRIIDGDADGTAIVDMGVDEVVVPITGLEANNDSPAPLGQPTTGLRRVRWPLVRALCSPSRLPSLARLSQAAAIRERGA